MYNSYPSTRHLIHIATLMVLGYLVVAKIYFGFYLEAEVGPFLMIAVAISYAVFNIHSLVSWWQRFMAFGVCVLIGYLSFLSSDGTSIMLFYFYIVESSLFYPSKYAKDVNILVIIVFLISNLFIQEANLLLSIKSVLHVTAMTIVAILAFSYAELVNKERINYSLAKQQLEDLEKKYEEMTCLAQRDGLTELYNYRTLIDYLDHVEFTGLAIILLDIDFFKMFNDTYGHLCGNVILKEMAQVIKQSVRDNDMVFRYGGEEFAVLLHKINENELKVVADRIVRSVRGYEFKYNNESVGLITVSVGYALANPNLQSSQELVKAADMALYKAKANGRDTVCCYKEVTC